MSRKLVVSVIVMITLALSGACGGGEAPAPQTAPEEGAATPTTAAAMEEAAPVEETGGEEEAEMGAEAPTAPTEGAEGEEPAPVEEEATAPAEEEAAAPAEETGEEAEGTTGETTDLEIASGADYLDSYRIYYTISFNNTSLEETMDAWTGEMVMEITVDAASNMHFFMDMSSIDMGENALPNEAGNTVEMYQVDEATYVLADIGLGEPLCTPVPDTEGIVDVPEPGDIGGTLQGARLVQAGEEMNGVATDHYTVENIGRFLENTEFGLDPEASADVWVAQEGGYLVKFSTTPATVGSGGEEGTMSMEMELQDINQVEPIVLPEKCANAQDFEMPDLENMRERRQP